MCLRLKAVSVDNRLTCPYIEAGFAEIMARGNHGGVFSMADFAADLSGIQAFTGRLTELRMRLDLTGIAPLTATDVGSPLVIAGVEDFGRAKATAAGVVDSYLAALIAMAQRSVTTIQAQDADLADAARRSFHMRAV